MADIPKDVTKRLFERNPIVCCWAHDILVYLGIVFLLIGVIGDATHKVLGLQSTHWFIMMIGFWMLGIFTWFRGYYSAKENVD